MARNFSRLRICASGALPSLFPPLLPIPFSGKLPGGEANSLKTTFCVASVNGVTVGEKYLNWVDEPGIVDGGVLAFTVAQIPEEATKMIKVKQRANVRFK